MKTHIYYILCVKIGLRKVWEKKSYVFPCTEVELLFAFYRSLNIIKDLKYVIVDTFLSPYIILLSKMINLRMGEMRRLSSTSMSVLVILGKTCH